MLFIETWQLYFQVLDHAKLQKFRPCTNGQGFEFLQALQHLEIQEPIKHSILLVDRDDVGTLVNVEFPLVMFHVEITYGVIASQQDGFAVEGILCRLQKHPVNK